LVKNAEQYYRSMFRGRVSSWNLRDRQMAQTLEDLIAFSKVREKDAKVVVWAHNSHLGDARATQMGRQGELNVGQLVRERHASESVLVGFTTYTGTVTAASNWGGPAERKRVRPALPSSCEGLFHSACVPRFVLRRRDSGEVLKGLREPILERAIGVIYLPESELASHYFYASLPLQFDAVIHFDQTRAVEPLERTSEWGVGEPAETFPEGL
jgi:erythromycin esterase-like protein